ncbi:exported hypothetical protein [Desulfamplus magnetovallimortis]|uniref:Ice-binding protein C-terminal domain-containing protein n=1 Tax=Desulfamplus magnetovallimortis TaxID=1246637 RepID=A0A1W1HDS6_9BACT|nr:PEP-CTERM sorting domain-containing protein [Desulfamplus magnetovallimortis]SLM30647.1 exported hypothetical protein [Desulfamplus magnetovallimortis]
MKIKMICLASFILLIAAVQASAATTITHDYGTSGYTPTQGNGPDGSDYWTLDDSNSTRFSDFFDLSQFSSLDSVLISVRHIENNRTLLLPGYYQERWSMEADNHTIQFGDLSNSKDSWQTDYFYVDDSYFNTILEKGGIGFHFSESTWFNDIMKLDNITLTIEGTSSPVPVPAALWLFGSGLLGMVSIRKKLKK